jgi:hypothetical protein
MQTNTRTSSRILCNNCQNTHNHFQPINSIIIISIFFFLFIRETPQCNSTIPSVHITMRINFLSPGNFFNYENHPSPITHNYLLLLLHFSNSYMQLNDISEPQHDHPSITHQLLLLLHFSNSSIQLNDICEPQHDHPLSPIHFLFFFLSFISQNSSMQLYNSGHHHHHHHLLLLLFFISQTPL